MNKIKEHFKNNVLIYLILFTCIIVLIVAKTATGYDKYEPPTLDTSNMIVVDIEGAMEVFDKKTANMIVVGSYDCSATMDYEPYIHIVELAEGFKAYYSELSTLDTNSESFKKFYDELDTFETNVDGKHGTLKDFFGATPLTLFIKNGKIVYGYYGVMNENTLDVFVKKYGVGADG